MTQGLAKRPPATASRLLITLINGVVILFRLSVLIMVNNIIGAIAQFVMVTPLPSALSIISAALLLIVVVPYAVIAHDAIHVVLTISWDVKDGMITPVIADLANHAIVIFFFGS
jgi:uncharacterized membrane protein YdbT with pleckstrin-like domain